jgi:hypothetical protein
LRGPPALPGRSARAKRRQGTTPLCAVSRPALVCCARQPAPNGLRQSLPGEARHRAGRMALIDEARAGCSTLLIAPDRRDALASGSGLNTRSAALSGRHLCSPPLTGRAAAVGHLQPVVRISRGWRSLARRCFVRNGERLAAFAADAGGSMFAIRRLSMCAGCGSLWPADDKLKPNPRRGGFSRAREPPR